VNLSVNEYDDDDNDDDDKANNVMESWIITHWHMKCSQ